MAWLGLAVCLRMELCSVHIKHFVKQVRYVELQEDHVILTSRFQLQIQVFFISISYLRNFLPKHERFLLKHLMIDQNCKAKCYNLYICNIIHKTYVIGNVPLSVSHIGVSHMMYELFNNCSHGSSAKVYFWEIIETSELGNEVFSNNNNSSNKYIISLWTAAFNCLNMALGADLGYHWTSAAEKISVAQSTFQTHILRVDI